MSLEEVFSMIKHHLKANDDGYLATSQPELFVKLAFSTITKDDYLSYIKHAGYI